MNVPVAVWRRFPVRGPGRLLMGDLRRRANAGRVVALGPHGVRLRIDPANPPEVSVYLWGTYEPEVVEAARRLLPDGGVAVDIGANCGVLSCVLASLVGPAGKVVSVEPSATGCARIDEQAREGRLNNVTVVPVAISQSAGITTFMSGSIGLGVLPPVDYEHTTGAAVTVELASLAEVLTRANAGPLDLVKIDTDGSELEVLRSGRDRLGDEKPTIVFEHFVAGQQRRGHAAADLIRLFQELGYELWRPQLASKPRWSAAPAKVTGFAPVALDQLNGYQLDGCNLVAVAQGTGSDRLGGAGSFGPGDDGFGSITAGSG